MQDCQDSAKEVQREVAAKHRLGDDAVVWRWGDRLDFWREKHRPGEEREKHRAADPHSGVEQTQESQDTRHTAL